MAEMKSSLYQQVRKNVEDIEALLMKLKDMNSSGDLQVGGDVYGIFPDLKVLGVHATDKNVNVDNNPSDYVRTITYELKTCAACNLMAQFPEITFDHCMVVTYNFKRESTETEPANYPMTYQIAYISESKQYCRTIREDVPNTWGEWKEYTIGSGGDSSIVSPTAPENQKAGDYWYEQIAEL